MTDSKLLSDYSRALDEIYHLRTLLAYEAMVLDVHLGYKGFPKSRKEIGREQSVRMRKAAVGDRSAFAVIQGKAQSIRRMAGLPLGLTRQQWEAEG